MIKSFQHAGLEKFYEKNSKAGIQPVHAKRLRLRLAVLTDATKPEDMDVPGWNWHPLKGDLEEFWSVWVDANWRLIFSFEGEDATLVDYRDYH